MCVCTHECMGGKGGIAMCITLKPVPAVLPRSMVALVLGLFTCTCGHQDSPFYGEKKDRDTH